MIDNFTTYINQDLLKCKKSYSVIKIINDVHMHMHKKFYITTLLFIAQLFLKSSCAMNTKEVGMLKTANKK